MCLSYLVWGKVVLSVCLLCYEDASYDFIDQMDHSKTTFQIYTDCDVEFLVAAWASLVLYFSTGAPVYLL